ncbi:MULTISPECIES: cytochrome c maturation protein CcmE [unclassified Devosia]|uniref:cytochrome c maturation protein CcmE n=1 Tax=unclassified Devosia TaxID=196773 RepID=UPI00086B0974|nr:MULTISPECIES: cytochrome c maturation protein CcmE [unclassified Devosia]MBN9360326.1 cytochrome c maturation protein CcmE [Devosia sp.]ODS96062.1 MAG: cytochrome c biogenesis protein CcmE [Devosia sp. SCN 66-27]OJX22348.1 MAG: cytochrome c biogenesis protein CcmE [Devosia sp. 66-14]
MTRKQKRLAIIAGLGAVLAIAATVIFVALRDQIVFFYSPSEIHEKAIAAGTPIRLGGLVKEGTWKRVGETSDFVVTDGQTEMATHYVGLLPDLFREGQGVVIEGSVTPAGTFAATNVLAKHDENYMPKELVNELKKRGEWQRDGVPL